MISALTMYDSETGVAGLMGDRVYCAFADRVFRF